MGDPTNNDLVLGVNNAVNNPIITNAQPPAVFTSLELFRSWLPRLFQSTKGANDARAKLNWQLAQITRSRGQKGYLIIHQLLWGKTSKYRRKGHCCVVFCFGIFRQQIINGVLQMFR